MQNGCCLLSKSVVVSYFYFFRKRFAHKECFELLSCILWAATIQPLSFALSLSLYIYLPHRCKSMPYLINLINYNRYLHFSYLVSPVSKTTSAPALSWRTLVRNVFVLTTRKRAPRHPGKMEPNEYQAGGVPGRRNLVELCLS